MAINSKASLQEILSHSSQDLRIHSFNHRWHELIFESKHACPKEQRILLMSAELPKCYVSLVLNFILFILTKLSSALSLPKLTPHSQAMHCRQRTIDQKGKEYPLFVLTKKDEEAFAAAACHRCLSDVTHWQEFKCETPLILQHVLLDQVPPQVKKKNQPHSFIHSAGFYSSLSKSITTVRILGD